MIFVLAIFVSFLEYIAKIGIYGCGHHVTLFVFDE